MHCQISICLEAGIYATQKTCISTVAHLLIWVQQSTWRWKKCKSRPGS